MQCKDIERWLVDFSEEDLSADGLTEIEEHLSACDRCARFRDDLNTIRTGINKMVASVPDEELVKQTRLRCHAQLRSLTMSGVKTVGRAPSLSMPRAIRVALVVLIVLTLIWMWPVLGDFDISQPLSFQTVTVLAVMIQNAAMLFFAPILIRKCRVRSRSLRTI